MDVQKILTDFKGQVDVELERYLDGVIADAQKKDPFITEALQYVKCFALAGGKRLRAAFMYYGYVAAGGTETEKMIKTSLSVELIHLFLLIHDDIIDRDTLRHKVDTLHFHYQKVGRRLFPGRDPEHFGNSIALIVGDMVGAFGNQILFDAPFEPRLVLRALSKLQSVVAFTVVGQAQDVYIEYQKQTTEVAVLQMYEYKTARYTVEGPLHLGAILAGGEDKILAPLTEYALPLGVAFQIQDDILGIFGTEERLGKAVGADIREGKITLLVLKALERLNGQDKAEFLQILGRGENLSALEIERFRILVRETGALEYARLLAKRYVATAQEALSQGSLSEEAREFLLAVAHYMAERDC